MDPEGGSIIYYVGSEKAFGVYRIGKECYDKVYADGISQKEMEFSKGKIMGKTISDRCGFRFGKL